MGFLTGRLTFQRFRVDGPPPALFGPEYLEMLDQHAIGRQRSENKDGVQIGWIAGQDILDQHFELAKNSVHDTLHLALRVDAQKLPGDLLRAYTRAELQALAAENPSGRPSTRQKQEARDAAVAKLEAEGKDGRFTRRKAYPLLWDRLSNCLLIGTSSGSVLDHVRQLFKATFGRDLVLLDAGQKASSQHAQAVADVQPSAFVPAAGPAEVAWIADPASRAFLGNEFLLWLWFTLEVESDTLPLADGSDVTVMLTRTLALECPKALSGSEKIRSGAPTQLPEARRAIQAGKLPRQAGLILVRHGHQYELTLQAETLAVSGAKLPATEEGEERARLEERVDQVRHLVETVDLLYGLFLGRRLGSGWLEELSRMQHWLQRDESPRLAEAS
jgi:hypothetical protein